VKVHSHHLGLSAQAIITRHAHASAPLELRRGPRKRRENRLLAINLASSWSLNPLFRMSVSIIERSNQFCLRRAQGGGHYFPNHTQSGSLTQKNKSSYVSFSYCPDVVPVSGIWVLSLVMNVDWHRLGLSAHHKAGQAIFPRTHPGVCN
jgi:hypothetical protein